MSVPIGSTHFSAVRIATDIQTSDSSSTNTKFIHTYITEVCLLYQKNVAFVH